MSQVPFITASLSPNIRQDIGLQVLTRPQPISHIAATHKVSRKFVYQQGDKAQRSLDEAFAPFRSAVRVLVTKHRLYQLILRLMLICQSSYRGIIELFRNFFDVSISVGTVHNRLEAAVAIAS